ncbi:hypothetical protein CTI12_AA297480 [Artemisia annua]|uniref:Uncharacterized protein n=1 Tax=Artemisia annua TaxID=35608 RepID=A0A2U1N7I5_ARTAN|nr:hypothetical protein CTI12_AA297480 [Artemisia annua]
MKNIRALFANKKEDQEVPTFDVSAWLTEFLAAKQKEYNAKRKKRKRVPITIHPCVLEFLHVVASHMRGFIEDKPEDQHDYDISEDEKNQAKADKHLIHLILQGLPNEIFSSMDSYPYAKTIWEVVERLMQGTKVGKKEKEVLYLWEYEKFISMPEETIESYYQRYSSVINELNINAVVVPPLILAIKFMLHLQPEWKCFITQVKQTKEWVDNLVLVEVAD